MQGVESGDGAIGGVVFDASGNLLGEIVADLRVGGKLDAFVDAGTVEGAVEGRIEAQIPAPEFAVHDGANFPGPGVGGKGGALISNFVRDADTDRPVPGVWNSYSRANVIA